MGWLCCHDSGLPLHRQGRVFRAQRGCLGARRTAHGRVGTLIAPASLREVRGVEGSLLSQRQWLLSSGRRSSFTEPARVYVGRAAHGQGLWGHRQACVTSSLSPQRDE